MFSQQTCLSTVPDVVMVNYPPVICILKLSTVIIMWIAAGEPDVMGLLTEGRRRREPRQVASEISAVSIYVGRWQTDVHIEPRPFDL